MAETTIAWADYTFNPWIGCAHVSEGCRNCYAEEMMDHRYGKVKWGPKGTRIRTSETYWKQPISWNRNARIEGTRRRVFCASLADVFEDRPELGTWRADLFRLIASTPDLDWLLLTKRPENILRVTSGSRWFYGSAQHGFGLPNVWLGTTVEDDRVAGRIAELVKIPARVHFVSYEPAIGPLTANLAGIDWVIAGGESGRPARVMDLAWVRDVRDRCCAEGRAFFMKQLGTRLAVGRGKGEELVALPEDLRIRQFPTVAA